MKNLRLCCKSEVCPRPHFSGSLAGEALAVYLGKQRIFPHQYLGFSYRTAAPLFDFSTSFEPTWA